MTSLLLWIVGLIFVCAALWLILVVLLQEGKSGGMSSEGPGAAPAAFSDSFGAGGAQKSMFRMTWVTAVIFFVLTIALTHLGNMRSSEGGSLNLPSGQTQQAPAATSGEPVQVTPESAPTAEDTAPAAEDEAPAQ